MNENTEAQTNISPDYPLNFLLAVDNKYRTYYIPADIDETIEYLLHIIFSNTPNDADILRRKGVLQADFINEKRRLLPQGGCISAYARQCLPRAHHRFVRPERRYYSFRWVKEGLADRDKP